MALIGSITNWGEIQGQINDANGVLTGVISSAELVGGQIVGMRGLQGEKGDQGDTGATGADGQDGADGFSPIASVSKVGDTATITITDENGTTTASVSDGADGQDGSDGQDGADGFSPSASVSKVGHTATITITDKDGTTTAEVHDGSGGGDVTDVEVNGTSVVDQDGVAEVTVPTKTSDLTNDVPFATTDRVTALTDGLMYYGDKIKLNSIEPFAQENVQSDWNEADSTDDAYIKNKPTIPTKTSDLNNDSGFLAAETDPVFTASDAYNISQTDIDNWDAKQDALVSGTNIKTVGGTSLLGSGNINLPQIRKGYLSLGAVNANSYKDVTVTFGSEMDGTPMVVCSMVSNSTSPTMGSISVSPTDFTASGFKCRVFNNTSSERSPALVYIAIYGG